MCFKIKLRSVYKKDEGFLEPTEFGSKYKSLCNILQSSKLKNIHFPAKPEKTKSMTV